MSLELTGLILAWLAIFVLALGYAGIVRALRDISDALALPARMTQVGKKAPLVDGYRRYPSQTLMLFASNECLTCLDVIPRFGELIERATVDLHGIVVYRSGGNERLTVGGTSVVVDASAFGSFTVDLVPTAVHIVDGQIRSLEPIGSTSQLDRFVAAADNASSKERETHHDVDA